MLIDFQRGALARGPPTRTKRTMSARTDRHAVKNITPHVFIERRTEPGWHFLTDEGSLRTRSRWPQGSPVHPPIPGQRS